MSVTFKWQVMQLDVLASENELSNVVKSVHWKHIATDGTNTNEIYGELRIDSPNTESFISYDSLSESNVISWLENKLDVADLQLRQTNRIQELSNKPTAKKLPWLE
jgi:hypothetical protein